MFEGVHITHHHAVDHHTGRLDDALYVAFLANADRAFLGIDITDHATFDLHRATEAQITTQLGVIRKDRKSTRLNSSHVKNSYAVFCLKKKKNYKILIN